ncbi:MAG: Alanine-tRNA ligase [Parcubacteria group bacterium GW2011_GWC2_45_7]|nr:MAG: Alanine-tRNA ligase [Parcubacteria group bacterium GW2011_GWC2_45_7]
MKASEIRKAFLNFFQARGHAIVPSSSLLPDDPSVLLTTAGMQQFKKYYTGECDAMKDFQSKSTASIQKCFRTSCIDEVGDATHGTFFEMLGNFSFGGYFKKEAITCAHKFITKEMGLTISYVTIFEGKEDIGVPKDTESRDIWKSLDSKLEVREQGMDDVFWGPTGSSGPCGPTTELYCKNSAEEDIEVWNIVFNQYFYPGSREELLAGASGKKLEPLKTLGVDTGMGLERLAMICQNVPTIFDTDLFKPLLEMLIHGVPQMGEREMRSLRIIVDHIRGATFLMADGVRPLNVEQGYILRRVIRRAIRHGALLNLPKGFSAQLMSKVIDLYSETYPELSRERNSILTALEDEQIKFERTLDRGLKEFEKITARGRHPEEPRGDEGSRALIISGIQAFHLYDTYGFPLELTKELAEERGLQVDEQGFQKAFQEHQEKSRAGIAGKFGGHGLVLDVGEIKAATADDVQKVTRLHTATHLLHQALRNVLGLHVKQMGSDITAERLRFDFTHPQKMTPEEIKRVEDLVNQKVQEDLPVIQQDMAYEEAIKQGALAFFKEKYPPRVKVYIIGGSELRHSEGEARRIPGSFATLRMTKDGEIFSKEICGGPHVTHTAEVGQFKITKEESSAAGVRRIRAIVV